MARGFQLPRDAQYSDDLLVWDWNWSEQNQERVWDSTLLEPLFIVLKAK